jgi:CheY-like chemotaxis protein
VKVFISSLIGGYEHYRAAAQEAIETLGHQTVRAEDFPATPGTPQQACLGAVRDADLVVLLVGERYGLPQPSGLSATHEEYREARERKPVLVFVEAEVTREPAQQAFLEEVQAWATGHFRASFSSAEELKAALLRALHDHELATSAGPVDEADLIARATALLPRPQGVGGAAQLVVAVAGGPHQQVVRPAELGDAALSRDIQREALFGEHPVLDPSEGTNIAIQGNALVFAQRVASVLVDQAGSVRVIQAARRDAGRLQVELPALLEEDIVEALAQAVRFCGWLLDRVDPLHRLTDVAVIAHLAGGGYLPWRTRAEHAASPNAATMGQGGDTTTVMLTPVRRHRRALTHEADRIAEDLATLLRRERRR